MQAKQCLFFKESDNCCDTATEEHIIQQGLAGTLSSSKIVCANCNNFFSQELDIPLTNLYSYIIIRTLSPLLSGKLKHRKIKIESNPHAPIEYKGGVASLSKITKEYSHDGKLKTIHAPLSTPPGTLEKIVNSEGVKIKSSVSQPLTESFPDINENICWDINNPTLIRAILLDILELAYHVHVTESFPNIAQHPDLDELRLWIRTGSLPNLFPPSSFASISDIIEPLFKPSTFSHRFIICFDYKSKKLTLVAQFVNTMPWVFVLEDVDLHSCSISILYQKALLGGKDQLLNKNCSVLKIKDIEWHKFCTTTNHACEFAKRKWGQEYINQLRRAYYERDLRHDEVISGKLAHYSNNWHGDDATVNAIVGLMENRYRDSPHIEKILSLAKKTALEKLINTFPSDQKDLFIYRECLKTVKSNFGYPTVLKDN